jgi:hypothetical protein
LAPLLLFQPSGFPKEKAMTDLMNLGFLLITFGLGVAFVWACERMK